MTKLLYYFFYHRSLFAPISQKISLTEHGCLDGGMKCMDLQEIVFAHIPPISGEDQTDGEISR